MMIHKENWIKVARAVGDFNPIHYDDAAAIKIGLNKVVCPGVYMLALAERECQKDWGKSEIPLGLKGNFSKFLYDREEISFEKEENGSVRIISSNEIAANFQIEPVSSGDRETEGASLGISEITPEKIKMFYEGLEISGTRPYFTFGFGGIISMFLNGREGVMLGGMKFNLYQSPELGALDVRLSVEERQRRGTLLYRIYGSCAQNGRKVLEGSGTGFKFG